MIANASPLVAQPERPSKAKLVYENPESGPEFAPSRKIVQRIQEMEKEPVGQVRPSSGPVRAVAVPPSLGLRYELRLLDDGTVGWTTVAEDRPFRSGERIQLVLESNLAGHLALLQLGSDGGMDWLFPAPDMGLEATEIAAHQPVVLPSEGHFFRFDDQPGLERILVIFARRQSDLRELGLGKSVDVGISGELLERAAEEKGSKNLLVEAHSDHRRADRSTIAVQLLGDALLHVITLEHR